MEDAKSDERVMVRLGLGSYFGIMISVALGIILAGVLAAPMAKLAVYLSEPAFDNTFTNVSAGLTGS